MTTIDDDFIEAVRVNDIVTISKIFNEHSLYVLDIELGISWAYHMNFPGLENLLIKIQEVKETLHFADECYVRP